MTKTTASSRPSPRAEEQHDVPQHTHQWQKHDHSESDTQNTAEPPPETSEPPEEATTPTPTTTPQPSGKYAVRVVYDGEWSGALSVVNSEGEMNTKSISGEKSTTFQIEGNPLSISVNTQKRNRNNKKLTVQILRDGKVISEASTTAAYGLAQTSESFW